jgi:acetate kinase
MKILVLNCGSSSLKASLREVKPGAGQRPAEPLWRAQAQWGRVAGKAEVKVRTAAQAGIDTTLDFTQPADIFEPVLRMLFDGAAKVLDSPAGIAAAGHRVVHGGADLQRTTAIAPEVKAIIKRLAEFAPEHNPIELETIEAAERVLGAGVPQFAVFDTAFHSTMAPEAVTYAGPHEWLDKNVRRYGFHGISYQYVSQRVAEVLKRPLEKMKLIACHLGNGCSLAAIDGGRSVDTTMGFTPLEGLMMGTRSGSIDPGIVIYLIRHRGYDAEQLDRMLNRESGLKGLSGISSDMRDVLAARASGNAAATLAYDVFVHRLCRELGGMLTSLGGLDALAFTAGIGENSAVLRRDVCRRLGFLGVTIDEARNFENPVDEDIAMAESPVRVTVIRTEEDWQIALECLRMLGAERS